MYLFNLTHKLIAVNPYVLYLYPFGYYVLILVILVDFECIFIFSSIFFGIISVLSLYLLICNRFLSDFNFIYELIFINLFYLGLFSTLLKISSLFSGLTLLLGCIYWVLNGLLSNSPQCYVFFYLGLRFFVLFSGLTLLHGCIYWVLNGLFEYL